MKISRIWAVGIKRVEAGRRYEGDRVWVWIPSEQIIRRDSSKSSGELYVNVSV